MKNVKPFYKGFKWVYLQVLVVAIGIYMTFLWTISPTN